MKWSIYFAEYFFEPVNEEKSLLLWDGGACNALSALHVDTKKYNGIKKRLILLGKNMFL